MGPKMEIDVTKNLKDAPSYFRAPQSVGTELQIDRKGGNAGAGIIRGVSVITEGEALGHGFWIDSDFNTQVAEAINQPNKGIKSRFTHPGLSGDGLGRHLGRLTDASVKGNKVIADQHFASSSHSTPDGDLGAYLMDLAEEDPEAYGLSIVFMHDVETADQFVADNSENGSFLSPDPNNLDNLPHTRLAELRAADAVDEPAANPDGLFHREQQAAEDATAIAAYALGQSTDLPKVACLGIDAGRVKRFVENYLSQNDLAITKEAKTMAEETKEVAEELDADTVVVEAPVEAPQLAAGEERTGADYLEAFGDQGGVWFAEGKSFAMCQALQTKSLQEDIEKMKQLQTAPEESGEETAVDFQAEGSKKSGGLSGKIRTMLESNPSMKQYLK